MWVIVSYLITVIISAWLVLSIILIEDIKPSDSKSRRIGEIMFFAGMIILPIVNLMFAYYMLGNGEEAEE